MNAEKRRKNVELRSVIKAVKKVQKGLLRHLKRSRRKKKNKSKYNETNESQYDIQMKSMEELEKEEAGPSYKIKSILMETPGKKASKNKDKKLLKSSSAV